jgi:uncharacterized membrane protein YoaT (DUF817 family)
MLSPMRQLVRFGGLEALSCLFPLALFAGLAVSDVVPLPIPRYDALLIYCLVLTFGLWAVGLETWREDQVDVWRLVHPAKFGAWSLLVSMSVVLVATVKGLEGRLYHRGVPPTVITPRATAVAKVVQVRPEGVQSP